MVSALDETIRAISKSGSAERNKQAVSRQSMATHCQMLLLV